jgi:hypothetical protein
VVVEAVVAATDYPQTGGFASDGARYNTPTFTPPLRS